VRVPLLQAALPVAPVSNRCVCHCLKQLYLWHRLPTGARATASSSFTCGTGFQPVRVPLLQAVPNTRTAVLYIK